MRGGDIDYLDLWAGSRSVAEFCAGLSEKSAASYLAGVQADVELVTVTPEPDFSYLYDLADSFSGQVAHVPRVIVAWAMSRPTAGARDRGRQASFPRVRAGDNKGHLISHAAGGGLDINLVPMSAALNLGRSPQGRRFRAMERYSATHPGALFFIRCIYADASDRPAVFEVVVEKADGLDVGRFCNDIRPAHGGPR